MTALVRVPHGLMRRYLSFLERLLVAAGLSALVFGVMNSIPVYPPNWDLVILATIFVVALWWPAAAYFLAVAAVAYPLYTLSLYIVVLFLAVALLGQRIFIHNMGAMVLVLASPWLARYNVAWVVPLLGGLWWGAAGGAWMGGLAALWGQVLAGMAGLNPDWLGLIGTSPTVAGVSQRFGEANSLDTLKLILEPLAPNATILLYHLLQVVAWATVGGVVGLLADRTWVQHRRPWGTILIGVAGAQIRPQWHILDAYATLVVAFLILKAALEVLWTSSREFTDTAPDPQVLDRIKGCAQGVEGVMELHDLRVRTSGGLYQMSLHVVVDRGLSVFQGHRIAKEVETCLAREVDGIGQVVVHVDPSTEPQPDETP